MHSDWVVQMNQNNETSASEGFFSVTLLLALAIFPFCCLSPHEPCRVSFTIFSAQGQDGKAFTSSARSADFRPGFRQQPKTSASYFRTGTLEKKTDNGKPHSPPRFEECGSQRGSASFVLYEYIVDNQDSNRSQAEQRLDSSHALK